ncbi:hypothetical protein WJX77_006810 [Trebouxia sp. C0004]
MLARCRHTLVPLALFEVRHDFNKKYQLRRQHVSSGSSPGSANQCMLGDVYVRSRKRGPRLSSLEDP